MKPKRIKVKLRPCKMDVLGKGYYPIYQTVDKNKIIFIVKKPKKELKVNTLREARVLAVKM